MKLYLLLRNDHIYQYARYWRYEMKIVATIFSVLLILIGAVWFLQGINVIG